jgi:tetratricopeptide (TPR) repeat protein
MRKLLISLCLSACCSFLTAQNANPIQDAMANYDYETALSLIEQETPTVPLLYQKGRALKGLGNSMEALEVFQQIVAQDSLNPRAYIEAAECSRSVAKYKQALGYYRKALDLNPNNKYARIQYITLLLNQREYQEALGESSLLAEKDSSAIALHLMGQSFEGMQDPLSALGAYHLIQELYPTDYLAAAKLGQIYISGNDYDYAIDATEEYRKRDTTNIIVNQLNAQAYCLNKYYPTAIQRYEYLLSQGDSTFQTCYYLGISYYATGKYYEAHDMLEAARQYDPRNVNLLYYLGRSCAKTSWKEAGVQYLEEAIAYALPPDSAMIRLYVGLTDCYKSALMFDEQIKSLQTRYEKYEIENHKLLYDMAYVYYYSLRNTPKAEQCLEAYLKTRPKGSKELPQEVDSDGVPIIGENNRYNAAEAWLKDIRDRRKKEDFFKGKVDTASVAPIK